MVNEVIVPVMDQSGGKFVLAKWLKREGESVQAGEALCEIETSKASVEIPADVSGILRRVLISEGTAIPSLTVIALIADANEPLPEIDPYYRRAERAANEQRTANEERTAINRRATKAAHAEPDFASGSKGVAPAAGRELAHGIRDAERANDAAAIGGGKDSSTSVAQPSERRHEVLASPRARKLAAEHNLILASIAGSGPNGRIVEEDVRRAIQQK